VCKNLFSDKTTVMVIISNYKIMPALTVFLQVYRKNASWKSKLLLCVL